MDLPLRAEIPVPLIIVSFKKPQFIDSTKVTTLRNSESLWRTGAADPVLQQGSAGTADAASIAAYVSKQRPKMHWKLPFQNIKLQE